MYSKIFFIIKKVFIYFASIITFLWVIKPVRELLIKNGIIIESNAILGILLITIVLIFNSLDKNEKIINKLHEDIMNNFANNNNIIENGVKNIFPVLFNELEKKKSSNLNSLHIIGLTLYATWPQIQSWLSTNNIKNWNIYFFILDSTFIKKNFDYLEEDWAETAKNNLKTIEKYIIDNKEELENRNLKIFIKKYSKIPFIHGFKINNDSIYISYCEWNKFNKIAMPTNFYEHFNLNDTDKRTKYYTRLFNNHLNNL